MKLSSRNFIMIIGALVACLRVHPVIGDENAYTLITETIASEVLGEQRTVNVQLPKSYKENENKNYPIIYRLDGAGNLPMLNAVLERLQSQGNAPEVIIVAIENTDRLRDLYPTVNQDPNGPVGLGGGGANFLSFITKELMPVIESKYRVHDYRIMAGASAAGVFSLYALQKRPDLFHAVITYSAAVWWAYGASGKSTVSFFKNTDSLDRFVYTAIGNEPSPMRPYYDDMIKGIEAHKPTGLRWVNEKFDDVPHNLVSAAGSFNAYFNLFFSEYMQPKDYSGDIASIEQYYENVSTQRGVEILAPEWVIRELGYHYVNQGNHEHAIQLFQYGIAHYPNSPDANNGLAYGFEQAGKYEQALVHVNKALALANEDYDGYAVYKNRQERLLKQIESK